MNYPKLLEEQVKTTIDSFKKYGYSQDARKINERLESLNWEGGNVEQLIENSEPMFFNGDLKAKTVLIALNPGSGIQTDWDIPENVEDYMRYYSRLSDYLKDSKFDNFDGKQAAFLSRFKDTGITIPDKFWEKSEEVKKEATTAVLNQKLQLEFLPYPSREIKFISSNPKIKQLSDVLLPHFNTVLDTIVYSERKYVVFTSRLFEKLLKLSEKENLVESLEFSPEKKKEGVIKRNLSAKAVTFNYNGHKVNAVIANSFGSRALPNAFEKMSRYGKFCYELHPK